MQYSEDMTSNEFKRSIKSKSVEVGLELCFKNVYRGCEMSDSLDARCSDLIIGHADVI